MLLPKLQFLKNRVRYLRRLPWNLRLRLWREVFRDFVATVKAGDVVWLHNRPEYASALAELLHKKGVVLVLHMHNSHLLQCNEEQLRILSSVHVVFCSKYLMEEADVAFNGCLKNGCVLYNGASEERFYPHAENCRPVPQIAFTGRLVYEKGVHVLLEAMRLLQQRDISATCLIIGGATFGRSRETKYVRKLTMCKPPNVTFAGYMSGEQFAQELRSSDIYCCPSVWNDPFPLSPLEAMACGIPVVASNVGGLPEELCHGGGVLVPPGNPGQLACTLEQLIVDSELRVRLGIDALNVFKSTFRWEIVRRDYTKILARITS